MYDDRKDKNGEGDEDDGTRTITTLACMMEPDDEEAESDDHTNTREEDEHPLAGLEDLPCGSMWEDIIAERHANNEEANAEEDENTPTNDENALHAASPSMLSFMSISSVSSS